MRPKFIIEPAEEYHSKSGEFLSSHRLGAFLNCPALYHNLQCGEYERTDSPAYALGRAAHVLIVEGEQVFDTQYKVGGPINPRTGEPYHPVSRAFKDYEVALGKSVITNDQASELWRMAAGVRRNKEASAILDSEGLAEGVVRETYCDIACQSRIDWYCDDREAIVDLKTCADLSRFEYDARSFRYGHQLAFYRAVLAQQTGRCAPCYLIAVEKKEPYRCGVWLVSEDTLQTCQDENAAGIRRLQECAGLGYWPTGYEEPRVLSF